MAYVKYIRGGHSSKFMHDKASYAVFHGGIQLHEDLMQQILRKGIQQLPNMRCCFHCG